ncbi:MAG: hypothetical protein ACR2QW_08925 [bacterium]
MAAVFNFILIWLIITSHAIASETVDTEVCSGLPEKQIVDAILNQQYTHANLLANELDLNQAVIPSSAFYQALSIWHQGYQLEDMKIKKKGISALRKSIGAMQKTLATAPPHISSLALGLSKGHTARALLENEQFFAGYEIGMEARKHIEQFRELSNESDIGFDDTGLLLGLYEVYTHDLLGENQWLARKILSRGDRNKGISLIENAVNGRSIFASEAMRTLLAEVSWRTPETCKYVEAIDRIGHQFQGNHDFVVLRQGLLIKCGHIEMARLAHVDYSEQMKDQSINQEQIDKARFRILADLGDYKTLDDLTTTAKLEPYRQLAFANALDAAGQRQKAYEIYNRLSSSNDQPASIQSVAKVRLQFPYRPPIKSVVPQFKINPSVLNHC